MKKILFILAVCMLCPVVKASSDTFNSEAAFTLAKAVKLGRGSTHFTERLSSLNSNEIKNLSEKIDCDANCSSCDDTTGTCSGCIRGRYLSDNMCPACPAQHYCDGKTAVPNCQDVFCLAGNGPESNDNGCCCVANCTGVTCMAGYTPTPNASGCCCA